MRKKSVLISINPTWCALIASGNKTVEVRKTRPKLGRPFKCYIYCTKAKNRDEVLTPCNDLSDLRNGKVIGEFVCDWCDPFEPKSAPFTELSWSSLVRPRELYEYANGRTLYGWHISNLLIYETPKKINLFKRWNRTEENSPCGHMKWLYAPCETCTECNLKQPPQSWCYVEELSD